MQECKCVCVCLSLDFEAGPPCIEHIYLVPFFQQHLLTLCLYHILVILAICSTLHQQKDYNLMKTQIMFSIFSDKGFLK